MPPDLEAKLLCYGSQKKCPEKLVNVSARVYNTRMNEWNKYTHVCHTCDALIEYTSTRAVTDITCECGGKAGYLSVESATISPTNERKDMLDNLEASIDLDEYNPNALVTYKSIVNGEATYPKIKVVDLEWELEQKNRYSNRIDELIKKINAIEENLTEDGWYNPNYDKSEVLSDLCEILGFTPTKTVQFSGSMTFEGSIEVPLDEAEDFDLQYLLQDELYLTSNHGNLEIDTYEVDSVRENY